MQPKQNSLEHYNIKIFGRPRQCASHLVHTRKETCNSETIQKWLLHQSYVKLEAMSIPLDGGSIARQRQNLTVNSNVPSHYSNYSKNEKTCC